jgi:hypothetical protein
MQTVQVKAHKRNGKMVRSHGRVKKANKLKSKAFEMASLKPLAMKVNPERQLASARFAKKSASVDPLYTKSQKRTGKKFKYSAKMKTYQY